MTDYAKMYETDRLIEEVYASRIVRRDVHVAFTTGEYSYTDGNLIVVNPVLGGMYLNTEAIRNTEKEMMLDSYFSGNEDNAARLITRLQIIHEALRAKYIRIPSLVIADSHAKDINHRHVLETINEIVDDAYIENAGALISKTMEQYLKFYRILMKNCNNLADFVINDFHVHTEYEEEQTDKWLKKNVLSTYLEYMSVYILYPMIHVDVPPRIRDYFERTKAYFLEAGVTPKSEVRYQYVIKIYEEIEELLREESKEASGGGSPGEDKKSFDRSTSTNRPENGKRREDENLRRILGKSKTHEEMEMAESEGEIQNDESGLSLEKTLFDRYEDVNDQNRMPNYIREDLNNDNSSGLKEVETVNPRKIGCSSAHSRVSLTVVKPEITASYVNIYNFIKSRNKTIINTYRSRLADYLRAEEYTSEDKCFIGSTINSKRLLDRNKRYWIKKDKNETIPELGIIFMIDCSYSMRGERMKAVRSAMVVLNEVLYGQDIPYAVFGHSAISREREVIHNLCLDFDAPANDKYNLISLEEMDGSREGVSLMWAGEYLKRNCPDRKNIIIAVSDGEPFHLSGYKESFAPPESVIDAAECVKTIQRSGMKVIAIALEAGGAPCYEQLCKIYPDVIECTSLKTLPKQLLELISREIFKG